MRTLVWYDDHEAGIDEPLLFARLRQHGFVDGDFRNADAALRQRVSLLASALMSDLAESERKRADDDAFERTTAYK